MTFPTVYPFVDTTVFTDENQNQGDWTLEAMSGVLTNTVTLDQNKTNVVDGQGRVVTAYETRARTATPTSYSIYTRGAVGVIIYISATAAAATPSVVATVDGYDPVSATWYNILTATAITGITTKRLVIAPGVTVTANLTAATVLPDTIRIVMTHADADSITYSVSLDWIEAGDEDTAVTSGATLLTDGANIATNAALDNRFYVTLGGDRQLDNPTNASPWQQVFWAIRQDGTGNRLLTLDSKFRFGSAIVSATLSTTADTTDYLGAIYNPIDDKWDVIAFAMGYVG